jgi:hypothetical protein
LIKRKNKDARIFLVISNGAKEHAFPIIKNSVLINENE